MNITILGASGKTGNQLVEQSLAAGHKVSVITRRESAFTAQKNLKIVVGDVTDSRVIAKASADADVIISTLGTASSKSTLITDVVNAVIAASGKTNIKRFILMSSFGVASNPTGGAMKVVSGLMKRMFKDKVNSEVVLRASNLDWTIVHAARLTNQPKGSGLRVVPKTEKLSIKHKIARADVAAWMLKEARDNGYNKAEAVISR